MTQVNIFHYLITVPASTLVDTLILGGDSVGIITGKIIRVHFNIPNGVAFNAGVRVNLGNKHKIPSQIKGAESHITGNANPDLPFETNLDVYEVKPEFWGINNGGSNHSFLVTLEVEQ